MKYLLALTFLFISQPSQAEIYRGVDSEGNTFYSDTEQPNSELIPTPSSNTISMPKAAPVEVEEADITEEQDAIYQSFQIVSPANDATIRQNRGNISIALLIDPTLDNTAGHHISIYLDGELTISGANELTLTLANVFRGKHTLSASVTDKNGKTVISSNTVNFHMKRTSSQHNKPTGTPPGPRDAYGQPYTPGPQGTFFKPGPVPPAPVVP